MTRYIHASSSQAATASPLSSAFFLGEISRQKLQKVAESSDTLRRCVLIHNIMRSTASVQAPPTPPPSPTNASDQHLYYQEHHSAQQDYYDDEEEEEAYREAVRGAGGAPAAASASAAEYMIGVTSPSSRSGEQDWLDSILDDLDEEDVHVSVVDAEDDDEHMEDGGTTTPEWHPPLFPPPQCNFMFTSPPSSPPLGPISPPLGPISPRFIPIPDSAFMDECLYSEQLDLEDDSPPTSPPGLDADNIDSEDDSDDEYHYGMMYDSVEDYSEAVTPSASTEFPQAATVIPSASNYLAYDRSYNHLPAARLRPLLCQFRESNHSPAY